MIKSKNTAKEAKLISEEDDFNEKINQLKILIGKLYSEKKVIIEESKKCFKSDERDKAKYLSDKAKDYQNRIENLEKYYSDLTFYSNNINLINESIRIIDVRGLHADESIRRIEKRKSNLKGSGNLCVIVGTSNKSIKNELSISDLGMKIIEYLKNDKKCKYELNNPIKGRITVHYPMTNKKEEKEKENNIIKLLIIETELVINKIKFSDPIVSVDGDEMEQLSKEKELLIRKAERQREEALLLQTKIDAIKQLESIEGNYNKKDLIEEKNSLYEKINELNKKASLNYFKGNNLLFMKRNENNIIDLHGQYVNEALVILEKKLSKMKDEKELKVIYGSGNHSINHIQKIKPKILEFLSLRHYKYKEIDDASLVIYLNK